MKEKSGWQELFGQLAQLQVDMELLAADRSLDRAEGSRYLARLLASGLAKFNARPTSSIDYVTPRIGGFNPDYLFGQARINPQLSYRINGKLNDVHRLALGTYASAFGMAAPVGHLSSDCITCDSDGRFEVILSDLAPVAAPSQEPQDWLRKNAQTSVLMVRQLLLSPSDQPAELSLNLIETSEPVAPVVLTDDCQRDNMGGVLLFVAGAADRFFRWTRIISRISNTIEQVPAEIESEVKADPDTFYAIGYFDLAEDERLEVRVTPPVCTYWGLQTTNFWLEPIEHDVLVCHRNHATSEADADGSVTLSISPVEEARRNTLHTLGHRNGAIFFRVVGANTRSVTLPVCTLRKR